MTILRAYTLALAAMLVAGEAFAGALNFDTVVFADEFEGFTAGSDLANGTAPSTGIGTVWQSIGSGDGTISTAQSFGSGTKSLNLARTVPATRFPRYWTYPSFAPQADTAANTIFGVEFDLYIDEDAPGSGALSGWLVGMSPGGGATIDPGLTFSIGTANVLVYHGAMDGYFNTGFAPGKGWHTLEYVHEIGPDNGGVADDKVTVYLTRHAGNSAGALARTQIDQFTHVNGVPLGLNWRMDITNQGAASSINFDNIRYGTLVPVPEPASLVIVSLGAAVAVMHYRRKS